MTLLAVCGSAAAVWCKESGGMLLGTDGSPLWELIAPFPLLPPVHKRDSEQQKGSRRSKPPRACRCNALFERLGSRRILRLRFAGSLRRCGSLRFRRSQLGFFCLGDRLGRWGGRAPLHFGLAFLEQLQKSRFPGVTQAA